MKQDGGENDLVERIKKSSYFAPIHERLSELLNPALFTGRAAKQVYILQLLFKIILFVLYLLQVDEFLSEEVQPALLHYKEHLDVHTAELTI